MEWGPRDWRDWGDDGIEMCDCCTKRWATQYFEERWLCDECVEQWREDEYEAENDLTEGV